MHSKAPKKGSSLKREKNIWFALWPVILEFFKRENSIVGWDAFQNIAHKNEARVDFYIGVKFEPDVGHLASLL